MRAAALFVELTLFTFPEPKTSAHYSRGLGGVVNRARVNRGKGSSRRRLGRKSKAIVAMVLGAILEFMKRVLHLVVGLLKLSYRKV